MKVTKAALPYILGFFFGIVLSFFQEEMRKINSVWDFWNFYNSVKFVFPFIFMVLLISVATDVTAFGWEKTKKNIPAKLLAIKSWIQKERLGDFEKKLFVDKNSIFINIQSEKRFPLSSKLRIIVDYREKRKPILKKDFESKMKYEIARFSSMVHSHSPKSFELVSDIKLSNSVPKTFEIFSFDEKENIFWLHQKNGKPVSSTHFIYQ